MAGPYRTFTMGAVGSSRRIAVERWPRDLFDIYFLNSVSLYFVWQSPTRHLL